MAKVFFKRGVSSNFENIDKDPDSLYFVEDTHEIYLGAERFAFGDDIIIEISGTGKVISDIIWDKENKILTIVKGDISVEELEELLQAALEDFHEQLMSEVDSELNSESTHPIQNKAVFEEIEKLRASIPKILYDTKEGWDSKPDLISEKDTLYVYTNYDGQGSVELKFGDGLAYLIDLPIQDKAIIEHISDTDIHVSPEDRERWNDKVRCYVSTVKDENIVFTTD